MDIKEYHSRPEISKSQLDVIHEGIEDFLYFKENPKEETYSMLLGNVVHNYILEPEYFKETYIIEPKIDKRTKEGKAAYEDFLLTSKGKTPISKEMLEIAEKIKAKIDAHPYASRLIRESIKEKSYFGEVQGVPVRSRPDLSHDFTLIDLKTCQDASPEGFSHSMTKFRYHVQAAFYLDVVNQSKEEKLGNFVFIACETKPPFKVAVYEMPESSIERGREVYLKDLLKYKKFKETGEIEEEYRSITMLGIKTYAFID